MVGQLGKLFERIDESNAPQEVRKPMNISIPQLVESIFAIYNKPEDFMQPRAILL
jgi:hypothetical protein